MTRFFVRADQIVEGVVTLDSDDALHLDRVLRVKPGDEIGVLDGTGKLHVCVLISSSKSSATAKVVRSELLETEPEICVTIAQAIPKIADKLEWILQHGVEVGASRFWMFRSRRSEAGKLAERPDRWRKIVKTAAEQSGRAKLPEVELMPSLDHILAAASQFDLGVLCDEAESQVTIKDSLADSRPKSILVLVGPEGGWDREERSAATEAGIRTITLGKRVLRTETAALVAVSQLLFALDAG